jgi:hypothetical protein
MRESFAIGNTTFADVRILNVHGQPGVGFYRLAVQIVVDMHARAEGQEVTVTDLTAELYLREGAGHGPLVGHMATREQDIPFHSLRYNQEQWVTFDLELDAARLTAIEALRMGRDLNLRIHVNGSAVAPGASGPQRIRAEIDHPTTQSDWVRVLDGMGYRKTLLLEVPMPSADAREQFQQAIEHLREAQDLMMRGKYRDAVGRCRDVLESLETALGDATTAAPDNQRDWDKACRIRNVRRAFKVLTHPARHADQVSTQHEWGPEDAASVVTATAALLRLAAQV